MRRVICSQRLNNISELYKLGITIGQSPSLNAGGEIFAIRGKVITSN